MSRDPSGNLNPPESVRQIPGPPGPPDYRNGFSMSHDLPNLQNPERPCYSDEFSMLGGFSSEFSMYQDPSGNLRSPDGEESPLECSSQLWNHGN